MTQQFKALSQKYPSGVFNMALKQISTALPVHWRVEPAGVTAGQLAIPWSLSLFPLLLWQVDMLEVWLMLDLYLYDVYLYVVYVFYIFIPFIVLFLSVIIRCNSQSVLHLSGVNT